MRFFSNPVYRYTHQYYRSVPFCSFSALCRPSSCPVGLLCLYYCFNAVSADQPHILCPTDCGYKLYVLRNLIICHFIMGNFRSQCLLYVMVLIRTRIEVGPIVLIQKKNGTSRLGRNYRVMNEKTETLDTN